MLGQHADRIALLHEDEIVTYGELARRSGDLIARIVDGPSDLSGYAPRPPVGLLTLDPIARIVGMVAAQKLGRPFLPLDSAAPVGRLQLMLRTSGSTALVTDAEDQFSAVISTFAGKTVHFGKTLGVARERQSREVPTVVAPPEAASHILYTSGSTGQPKSIAQTHAMVMHKLAEYSWSFRISPEDRLSLVASPGFAESWNAVFMALLNGASLAIRETKQKGIEGLADWIREHTITIFHCVPTVLRGIVAGLDEGVHAPSLRLLNMGGETVSRADLHACWDRLSPDCIVVNSFGTTETKLIAQFLADRETVIDSEIIPVGRPIPGTQVRILGEDGAPLPAGEVGEIEVSSRFIARQYEESTPEDQRRFLSAEGDASLIRYRTGDLGRFTEDGLLEHLGRCDGIVKLRGYRVELAEVESTLRTHPDVSQVAVVVQGDSLKRKQLIAAFISENSPSSEELREHLATLLPDYMIPSRFVQVDELPVNNNGKVDRALALELIKSTLACNGRRGGNGRSSSERLSPTLLRLLDDVRAVLETGPIAADEGFLELGGDSLSATELLIRIDKSFGVRLSRDDLFTAESLAELAERIDAAARRGK
jgi:amino acid adenylation domain-containing protein